MKWVEDRGTSSVAREVTVQFQARSDDNWSCRCGFDHKRKGQALQRSKSYYFKSMTRSQMVIWRLMANYSCCWCTAGLWVIWLLTSCWFGLFWGSFLVWVVDLFLIFFLLLFRTVVVLMRVTAEMCHLVVI